MVFELDTREWIYNETFNKWYGYEFLSCTAECTFSYSVIEIQ